MFIRKTHSKNFTYLNLVHTFREKGKVKHRNVASLGRLDLLQKNNQIKSIALALLGLAGEPITVLNQSSEISVVKNWGYEVVCRKIFKLLKLDMFFTKVKTKAQYDLSEIVFALALQRLAKPSSKLFAQRTQNYFYGVKQYQLQHAYRALDILANVKDDLEQYLFAVQKEIFHMKVDVVFYDVTTFYFESQQSDELKDFGYSKDHKCSEVQVLAGLLIDQDGRPIAFEIFKGNTFEGNTG